MSSAVEPLFSYSITEEDRNEAGGVRILGRRTPDTRVEIPETIEGYPVTGIAPYAFSERQTRQTEGIEEITLPSSLIHIGKYAFYNCYKLKKLTCFSTIRDLGAGLFTGCGKLTEIDITICRQQKSCLKEILSELCQTLTVRYREPEGTALLVFPEFYEESVENTPARLLFNQTHGCGHRYRYCFEQTHFLFREYDALFPYARTQEDEAVVVKLALGRLKYPLELSEAAKEVYKQYIMEHWTAAGTEILEQRDLKALEWLTAAFGPEQEQVEGLIELAKERRGTEALGYLMDYRHEHFKAKKRRFEL